MEQLQAKGQLKLSEVQKQVGSFLLKADFHVSPGERVAIWGPSGCGKTTLLRLIAGLIPAEAGEMTLGDLALNPLPPERRYIGMVFQDSALFPAMNVLENATFGLRMRGVEKQSRDAQAIAWLERVGLKDRMHANVDALSGGEKQRVAFVRALLWKARLLLLDEPFSALDLSLKESLRRVLVELHSLWPVPLLIVTHDRSDLETLATRSLVYRESEASGSDLQVRSFREN